MEIFNITNFGYKLLVYIIACHGLCQILIYGTILERLKDHIFNCLYKNNKLCNLAFSFKKLMECPMCLGFWIGFFSSFIIQPQIETVIACSLCISATCYFLDILQKMIEKKGE